MVHCSRMDHLPTRLPIQPRSRNIDIGSKGELYMGIAYNIADMINKIGFGIVAWMGAKKATEALEADCKLYTNDNR